MAINEMPQMMAYSSAATQYNPMDWQVPHNINQAAAAQLGLVHRAFGDPNGTLNIKQPKEDAKMANTARRIVKVYVADTNDNVPLDATLLYSGEEKLTDLTDQELFFEIDIKTILDQHNEKRVTYINKAVKDRTEYLEPAKIRDLKMTVVTVAQF